MLEWADLSRSLLHLLVKRDIILIILCTLFVVSLHSEKADLTILRFWLILNESSLEKWRSSVRESYSAARIPANPFLRSISLALDKYFPRISWLIVLSK